MGKELHLSGAAQLALLEAFVERDASLRTTVHGRSMWPFVRDGDVVTIEPIRRRPPAVGEVVAVRHPRGANLVIHRVVGVDPGGWIVQGDACAAPDGVVPTGQVLGRIVAVERGGSPVRLGTGPSGPWVAALSRGGWLRRVQAALALPRRGAVVALTGAQGLGPFRRAGRRLLPVVEVERAGEEHPEGAAGAETWVARVRGAPVGRIRVTLGDEDGDDGRRAWLAGLDVRTRFRGLGVGERLVRAAIERARFLGARSVAVVVSSGDVRAIRLHEKVGFERAPDGSGRVVLRRAV